MTRGHNIVADGWAGAANPHPHPTLHPTPLPTQTHTQNAFKTLILDLTRVFACQINHLPENQSLSECDINKSGKFELMPLNPDAMS